MRYALISDIHGNAEALLAVLKDIEEQAIDQVISLGDVIGYGCEPSRCLELVEEHCHVKLMGNHEHLILGLLSSSYYNEAARVSARWTQNRLTDRERAMIERYLIDHVCADIYLVHGSPYEPEAWHYILAPEEALLAFEYLRNSLCFCGHSHVPMIFAETPDGLPRAQVGHNFLPDPEARYIVNVGSVGQPRDNDPRSCYVIFDTDEWEVTYRRVEYDIRATQQKMAEANLPEILIERLAFGR